MNDFVSQPTTMRVKLDLYLPTAGAPHSILYHHHYLGPYVEEMNCVTVHPSCSTMEYIAPPRNPSQDLWGQGGRRIICTLVNISVLYYVKLHKMQRKLHIYLHLS